MTNMDEINEFRNKIASAKAKAEQAEKERKQAEKQLKELGWDGEESPNGFAKRKEKEAEEKEKVANEALENARKEVDKLMSRIAQLEEDEE